MAGFFPIHKNGEHPRECGEIQKEDGIQPLEAMLFTLDEINANEDVLPGIKLGAIAVDSCDNPIQASEKAFPLLVRYFDHGAAIIDFYYSSLSNRGTCTSIYFATKVLHIQAYLILFSRYWLLPSARHLEN